MMIWVCPEGAENVATVGSGTVPTCDSMQGQWIEQPTHWWAAEIPAEQVGDLLSVQLLFFAVVFVASAISDAIG